MGEITVQRDGAVLTIALNRPERLNSVTTDVLNDLADLIEEAAADAEVRVIVLTGTGRAFSSGADLKSGATATGKPGTDTILAANRVIRALRDARQPTVAAVNGPAVGVGCSLALACDLTLASSDAYFLLSFTSIGLMPDGGATALVPTSIGRARAMAMAMVPERIPAAEAVAWGLIYKAVDAAELAAALKALTDRLSTGAPLALAATKRAVNEATLTALEGALGRELEGQGRLLQTADVAEAVIAFIEKRPPKFTGS
ncbi:enoyl-CoA hydratase [Cryptosporangium aurantiacum]|uniref:Enoyl-CoA hydratase n=1 Tax=Cryptosporangium aurantiacum TaxID=134849 RepID=A0A1M7RLM8_9ACTN|nr:enoyl-CoA hydratase [Cryptosporangium aurantiacum]SHN47081.1 Enoyl-CoA hydratase [Cryptosporangium aurantiacum]